MTPGPWHVNQAMLSIFGPKDRLVCDMPLRDKHKDIRHEERQANAKLIAAAPEMLDALRNVMPLLAECDCIHSDREAPLCPCRAARALLTAFDGSGDANG